MHKSCNMSMYYELIKCPLKIKFKELLQYLFYGQFSFFKGSAKVVKFFILTQQLLFIF